MLPNGMMQWASSIPSKADKDKDTDKGKEICPLTLSSPFVQIRPAMPPAAAAAAPPEGVDTVPKWARDMGLAVGDEVMCSAKRNKVLWDNKRGKVLALLHQHCKVEILSEGQTLGDKHKYDRISVEKLVRDDVGQAPGERAAKRPRGDVEDGNRQPSMPDLFDASDLEA
jgi:hypothetical protein